MNKMDLKKKLKNNKIVKLANLVIFPVPYPKYYKKCSVDKSVVLYESFYGNGMTCSPKAIFNQLKGDSKFKELTHVWVYNNENNWKNNFAQYKDDDRVKFVKYKSRAYYKYLATAGWLVNNSTFPQCYTRKEGQVYINTWHGIPLKLMGYDMPNGNIEVANTERNFLQASYLLSPNSHHTSMYADAYKLKGIFGGKIIETGQARTDTIFNTSRRDIIRKLVNNGTKIDSNKKIILYAPTWKGESFSNPKTDVKEFEDFFEKVSQAVEDAGYQLLIKPHQAIYQSVSNASEKLKDYLIAPSFDTNEVLATVDVLVSDYSSIFFDFLVTGKPIMFYIPDLEQYVKERGTYLPIESLPGPATADLDELSQWLLSPEEAVKNKANDYTKTKEEFCKYDDGHVAERIVDAIWNNNLDKVYIPDMATDKKKIFISLGRALQNGITHSFLSLLNNIDHEKTDVTAYLYEAVAPDQVVRINQINKNVRVLIRTNYVFATRTELFRMVLGMIFNAKGIFRKVLPDAYFERYAKRIVGDTQFDSVVEFCGYSPILAMILPKMKAKVTAIWQHNDLIADANRIVNHRKPLKKKMKMIFNLYEDWDRLVACSYYVMEVNKKNLSTPKIEDKFFYARNTINYGRVLECIENGCTYDGFPLPAEGETNFVTMGRLSPEKNHIRLVRAFGEYVKDYPNSKLYIIGEGPLREQVVEEIGKHRLQEKVILTGNLQNPFTLMSMCDCFILPSIYEGQPMVLLEARIVGLPIVVADFSSVKGSLIKNGQYLIKSTEESILDGLKAFSEGRVPKGGFEPWVYNREAIEEFEDAIY